MGELCKECFKKCMNPDVTDDFLIMSETFDICERCNNFGPIVLGEGVIDELGGWHIDGIGINPLGQQCGECSKLTCVSCPSACIYEEWVRCNKCINFKNCNIKNDEKGCYFGEMEYYNYYHIRPIDDGCVVLAYNPNTRSLFLHRKGEDTQDTLVFPTEEAASNWIKHVNLLRDYERTLYRPEIFTTSVKQNAFTGILQIKF